MALKQAEFYLDYTFLSGVHNLVPYESLYTSHKGHISTYS